MAKYVYFFGDGEAEGASDMRNLLGGKGANLAEMTSIGLPVPAGFTLTTEVGYRRDFAGSLIGLNDALPVKPYAMLATGSLETE